MTTDATPKAEPGFLVVTGDTRRDELEEALGHLARRASRTPYFFDEHPKLHARINQLLDYRDALISRDQVFPPA